MYSLVANNESGLRHTTKTKFSPQLLRPGTDLLFMAQEDNEKNCVMLIFYYSKSTKGEETEFKEYKMVAQIALAMIEIKNIFPQW